MPSDTRAPSFTLEPTSCGLCGSDAAEPVAVGEDFRGRTSPDTYLAVRCSACGLIYLTPVPTGAGLARVRQAARDGLAGPLSRFARPAVRRSIARWGRRLPADATVLLLGLSGVRDRSTLVRLWARRWRLLDAAPDETGGISTTPEPAGTREGVVPELLPDAVHGAIVLGELEQHHDPSAILSALRRVLRRDGRVLVISTNPGSAAARVFSGRHWSGYDFPRHRALADQAALRWVARRGGFMVDAVSTIGDAGAWPESAATLLRDWEISPALANWVGSGTWTATSIGRLLEWIAVRCGKGGLVVATLRPVDQFAS